MPLINKSAQNWTMIAEILKKTADEYKNNCLEEVNLGDLHEIVLKIHQDEELLFTILLKLKV